MFEVAFDVSPIIFTDCENVGLYKLVSLQQSLGKLTLQIYLILEFECSDPKHFLHLFLRNFDGKISDYNRNQNYIVEARIR